MTALVVTVLLSGDAALSVTVNLTVKVPGVA